MASIRLRFPLVFALFALACSAEKGTPSSLVDAGESESSIADTAAPPPSDTSPLPIDAASLTLDLQPSVATIHFDLASPTTPATQVFWTYIDGPAGKEDVTASTALTIEDPSIGTFKENVFTSTTPLPFTTLGKTVRVTARRGGELGIAKLTLVRLRTTGPDRDLLFQAPHGLPPTPAKDIFLVVVPAGATSDVHVVLRSDPANPDGVDAKKFVKVRAMKEGNAKVEPAGCEPHTTKDTDADGTDDTFVSAAPGKKLCFETTPITNVTVTSQEGAGFHRVFLDLVAMPSGTKLGERSVVIVVPPTDPRAK